MTFAGTATGDISVSWAGEVNKSVATFSRGGVQATTKPDFSDTAKKISVEAGQILAATAAQVNGVTLDVAGTVKVNELEHTTSADFRHITATLNVSMGATANVSGANLTIVDSLSVDDGDDTNTITATLSATQDDALVGKITKGADDKIAASVTDGADLTALNLDGVDSITVTDGFTVTATVAQAGKISLGNSAAYHLKDTAASLTGADVALGKGATNIKGQRR